MPARVREPNGTRSRLFPGSVAAGRGDFAEALALFDTALEEVRAIGSNAEALEILARVAECHLLAGDVERALVVAGDALVQARALGGVSAQLPLLHRVRAAALARSGDAPAAADALGLSRFQHT